MRYFFKAVSLMVLLLAVSCVDDDDNMNIIDGPTALDFLKDDDNYTVFVKALERTQLDFNLNTRGSITVFAPTNQAFATYLASNNISSIDAVPVDELRLLLAYHIQLEVKPVDLFNSQYYKTTAFLEGSPMDVYVNNTANGLLINNVALVILPDNTVSNGVVHVIDQVLSLPSVVTLLASNPNFSNLVTALNQEGLSITLRDNADASGPFTVFAPDNTAFDALIASNPNDELNNFQDVLDQDNLDDQLLYHVLGSQALRLSDFVDGSTINPLGTGTLNVATTSGVSLRDGSGTTTNITSSNITAFNGVVHTLDFVLRQN